MSTPAPAANSDAARARNARELVVLVLALGVVVVLVWYLRGLVLLLYASVLFAVMVTPAVTWIESRRIGEWKPPRGLAVALVAMAAVAGVVGLLVILVPPLIAQGSNLATLWPAAADGMLRAARKLPDLHNLDTAQANAGMAAFGGWALGMLQRLAQGLIELATILLLTVYLLAEGESAREWCLAFFRPGPRSRLALTLERGERRMRGWIAGQAALAVLMAVASGATFAALGLPDFYVLALMSGLLTFVPVLGPITAALVAGSVAAMQSWGSLAGVLIFFALYETLDNVFLTPRIMSKSVGVPGLAVLVALAIGAALGGLLGAVLAVPSAALAAELLREYARPRESA